MGRAYPTHPRKGNTLTEVLFLVVIQANREKSSRSVQPTPCLFVCKVNSLEMCLSHPWILLFWNTEEQARIDIKSDFSKRNSTFKERFIFYFYLTYKRMAMYNLSCLIVCERHCIRRDFKVCYCRTLLTSALKISFANVFKQTKVGYFNAAKTRKKFWV